MADKTTFFSARSTFVNGVNQLLRLDRETGTQVAEPLTSNQLHVNLPGGTGALYKYDTGDICLDAQLELEMVEVTAPGDIYHSIYEDPDTPDEDIRLHP